MTNDQSTEALAQMDSGARICAVLHRRLLLSAACIGIFVVTAVAALMWLTAQQKNDAHASNIASRQRMLSQKLATDALQFKNAPDAERRIMARRDLQKSLSELTTFHNALFTRDPKFELEGHNHAAVTSHFKAIEPAFNSLRRRARELLERTRRIPQQAATQAASEERLSTRVSSLIDAQFAFLAAIEGIVSQNQQEAERGIHALRMLEIGMMAGAFIGLIGITFGIYRPAIRIIEQQIEELRVAAVARCERELNAQAEKKYHQLFDSTRDAVTVMHEGRFVDGNQAALTLFGCDTLDELRGLTAVNVSPEFQPCRRSSEALANDYIEQAVRDGSVFFDWTYRQVDGGEFQADVLFSAIDYDDKPMIQATVRDITKRKEAEYALAESEATFQQMGKHLDDVLWMTSADGMEIIYVSHAYESIWGRSCDTLYEHPADWIAGIHPEERQRVAKAFYEGAASGDYNEIFRVVRPDDSVRWIHARGFPIRNEADEVYRVAGVARDVTTRKLFEEDLLVAKQAAEAASIAKSQFLASMSHELRTPLNGVIGMTELLADTDLNDKQQQFVDACRNSGESLLQLINDILDFSKIEAGKLDLDLHDFDLEKLVTDTVETMAWRAADKNLEMPCYVDQASRLVLTGDSNRLRQVLVNLLGNAVKFTEVGEVVVRTKIVARQDDQIAVRFLISDTGIGIPSDKLDRLFRSFSQVDASTTRTYGGSGLGLAISQKLVELMGGTICVETKEAAGSTFWFDVTFALASESTEDIPETSPLAGRRTLIVDDNETNRIILAEYTAGWGLTTVSTASVDEALAEIHEAEVDGTPFQLVLTDYNMPDRNGLELAQALKEHPELVVLLLGSTDIHLSAAELREHGIRATLRKPIRRQELHDVLCRVIASVEECDPPSNVKYQSSTALTPATSTGRVLLAEDNSINQMYVVELMKQLGCACHTVANGREALDAVQQGSYDLVLMDCQMPEMDGFEATRRIRQLESDGKLEGHMPIVALTANAITGDREQCLDSGMDEYLSKPVQKHQVISVLKRYLSDARPHRAEADAEAATPDKVTDAPALAPIDARLLQERCFGNLEFAASLLEELECSGPQRIADIRREAGQQNAVATAEAAHALKGAAGILCAEAVQQLAAQIEQAARSLDIKGADDLVEELASEMQRCLDYVPQLRHELNTAKVGA